MFNDLFNPLHELCINDKKEKRNNAIVKGFLIFTFSIALVVGGSYVWSEYQSQQVRNGQPSLLINAKVKDIDFLLNGLNNQQISDDNFEQIQSEYEKYAKMHPKHAHRFNAQWSKVATNYRKALEERIQRVRLLLKQSTNQYDIAEYKRLAGIYNKNIGVALPLDVSVPLEDLLQRPYLAAIDNCSTSGTLSQRVTARVNAIEDYLNRCTPTLIYAQKEDISRTLQFARHLLENNSYILDIEAKGLNEDFDTFLELQIGDDNNPSDKRNIGERRDNSTDAGARNVSFKWSLDQKIKITLWDHDTIFLNGKIADIWADAQSGIPLLKFVKQDWQPKSFAFEDEANNVLFRFRLKDGTGKELNVNDFELIHTYILGNDFWRKIRQESENRIDSTYTES